MTELSVEAIEAAYPEIQKALRKTPLLRSETFEQKIKSKFPVYFKVESLQHTGSFKARGALTKLLSVKDSALKRGVVTASAGNHAQGVAFHCKRLGIHAKIVMPESSPAVKLKNTRQWGAEIILYGESYQESYERALQIQKEEGREYIHAFDDWEIMAGQGTLALEVLKELPDLKVFVAPIGGGGLLGGCATYLRAKRPDAKIVAVQAEGASTFLPSLKAGKPITLEKVNTIAEGMSAKRLGDRTFGILKKAVDETVVVSDEEIAEGVLWLLENERLFVEGCAGSSVAAVLQKPSLVTGPTCIVLSGGNLDTNFLALMIERGLLKTGRLVRLEATMADVPGSLMKFIQVFAEQKASVVDIQHERIFGKSRLREVRVKATIETQGPDHIEAIEKALKAKGWNVSLGS